MKVYLEKVISTTRAIYGICESDSYTIRPVNYPDSYLYSHNVIDDNRFFRRFLLISLTYDNGLKNTDNELDYKLAHPKVIKTLRIKGYNEEITNLIRNYLCLGFGKVVFDHGVIRHNEYVHSPNSLECTPIKHIDSVCCNNQPRSEFEYGYDISAYKKNIDKFFMLLSINDDKIRSYLESLNMYYNALTYINIDETISFILLVSAVEKLLYNFCQIKKEDYIKKDKDLLHNLELLEKYVTNQKDFKKLSSYIMRDKYGTKQKFRELLYSSISEDFDFGLGLDDEVLLLNDNQRQQIFGHMYDIRSDYVHSRRSIYPIITSYGLGDFLGLEDDNIIDTPLFLMEKMVRCILNNIHENVLVPEFLT